MKTFFPHLFTRLLPETVIVSVRSVHWLVFYGPLLGGALLKDRARTPSDGAESALSSYLVMPHAASKYNRCQSISSASEGDI